MKKLFTIHHQEARDPDSKTILQQEISPNTPFVTMEIRHRPRSNRRMPATMVSAVISAFVTGLLVFLLTSEGEGDSLLPQTQARPPSALSSTSPRVKVLVNPSKHTTSEKVLQDLQRSPLVEQVVVLDGSNDFVRSCPGVSERLDQLAPHLQVELLKYCALSHYKGGLYLDSGSPLMDTLDHVLSYGKNIAVLNDPFVPRSVHGALLWLKDDTKVAANMLQILLTTSVQVLESSPLLLAKSLYDIIATRAGVGKLSPGPVADNWYLLQHSCTVQPLGGRAVTTPISTYALNSYR